LLLEEEVYIEQPPGYTKVGKENKVLKLKKERVKEKEKPMLSKTSGGMRLVFL
jgi:hypothetical protein